MKFRMKQWIPIFEEQADSENRAEHRYLRTSSKHMVSEATVLEYLRKNFFSTFVSESHFRDKSFYFQPTSTG